MEKNLLVFSNYYTCWNVICSYSPVFLLVAPEVWTPSGGLLSLTHSGIPSGLLAHLAVLQGVLFRQHFLHNLPRDLFRQHFLHNLPRENLCFKLFTQSYSFSDMTVVSSGTPAGDIPNVSSVMFLTDLLLPFLRGS